MTGALIGGGDEGQVRSCTLVEPRHQVHGVLLVSPSAEFGQCCPATNSHRPVEHGRQCTDKSVLPSCRRRSQRTARRECRQLQHLGWRTPHTSLWRSTKPLACYWAGGPGPQVWQGLHAAGLVGNALCRTERAARGRHLLRQLFFQVWRRSHPSSAGCLRKLRSPMMCGTLPQLWQDPNHLWEGWVGCVLSHACYAHPCVLPSRRPGRCALLDSICSLLCFCKHSKHQPVV